MSAKDERPILIVKRVKRGGAAHHGGAWKVAYADFVTAMMAFFMVMWLISSVTKEQRAAIFDYFKNPSMEDGKSPKPAPGQMGPGGASTSVINLGGGLDARKSATALSTGLGTPKDSTTLQDHKITTAEEAEKANEVQKANAEGEHKKLESLMAELRQAIDMSQALRPFKDQLLLDITAEGLRIQIVDAQNRPMFDLGSARLKDYTGSILHELAPYLNSVPNRISISGHTDTTPYIAQAGYTNWDLSSDRANAARRALELGGLAADKTARVIGLSSAVLFDKDNPRNPINRRISIIVMTKEAEDSALKSYAKVPVLPADIGVSLATDSPAPEPAASPAASPAAPPAVPPATTTPSAAAPAATVAPASAVGPASAAPAAAPTQSTAAPPAKPTPPGPPRP